MTVGIGKKVIKTSVLRKTIKQKKAILMAFILFLLETAD